MKKQNTAAAAAPMLLLSGEVPHTAVIPTVPEGFKLMEGTSKNALLKASMEQRAEIDQAMEQLWEKRSALATDLGTLAPDADAGKALHEKMIAAREANRKTQALAAYTEEQEALTNHAVLGYLNRASGDIEHMAERNPQIADRYPRVLAVSAQRREAIAAGIARAKAAKAEAKKG